jgi:hypothetical protein
MKLTSPTTLLAISFFIAIGGCASSEDDTGLGGGEDSGSDAHGATDTGGTVTDTGGSHTDTGSTSTDTGTKSEGGGTCVSHCASNAECDASCPASPTGSYNCCDTATGICYVSAGFCPAGGSDSGGVDTSPY